jgi:tetratricopeptide (TPR) repeat protein
MTTNQQLLNHLAELMLNEEKHFLAVDSLFDDAQIGNFIRSIQIDSPYQQLISEGVLTETVRQEQLYVSFTIEGYFHYVLGEVIYRIDQEKSDQYLIDIVYSNKLIGLKEGVANCLFKYIQESKNEKLISFIKSQNTNSTICVKPLANSFILKDFELIVKTLINDDLEDRYFLILLTLKFLEENNKHVGIENFWKVFIYNFKQFNIFNASFYKSQLIIKSLLHNNNNIKQFISDIGDNHKNYFKNCSDYQKYIIYFELYNIIVSKGLLKEAFDFSIKIKLYEYSQELLIANYYNVLYPLLELQQFEIAENIYKKCFQSNKKNGYFINWSGWIYQAWYELKSHNINHLDIGISLYHDASEIIEIDFGKYSIQKYQNLENLGYAYLLKGDPNKSYNYLDNAISILQNLYQTDVTYLLGTSYLMKAVALFNLKRYDEALHYSFCSDKCKLLQISEESPEMAWNHYDRANIYLQIGELDKAKESMKIAYTIRKNALGDQNGLTIHTKAELSKMNI